MIWRAIARRLAGTASLASRALNVLLLGGSADETTSMRLFVERRRGGAWALAARAVNLLFRWQSPDHVRWAALEDTRHGEEMARRVRRALGQDAPPPGGGQ